MDGRAAPHVLPAAPESSAGSPVMEKMPLYVRRWWKTWKVLNENHSENLRRYFILIDVWLLTQQS